MTDYLGPPFSYSFCKNGYFDNINTKSEVGIFDEYFRLEKYIEIISPNIFIFMLWKI